MVSLVVHEPSCLQGRRPHVNNQGEMEVRPGRAALYKHIHPNSGDVRVTLSHNLTLGISPTLGYQSPCKRGTLLEGGPAGRNANEPPLPEPMIW